MKFTVPFGLLLIFWLPRWSQSMEETVDIDTLARIINFFEQNYKRVDPNNGHPRQYATAINVPKHQCQADFTPLQSNFLTQENASKVNTSINDETNALYQGAQLIAAGLRKQRKNYIHSESLLLNPADNSPMTKLLQKNNQDCSIFYTFNSPCVDTCLNEKSRYKILKALENWGKHSGVKAFVFKDLWKFDLDKPLKNIFKLIASRVPLYRCVSETVCYACGGEGNTPINEQCLPPPPNNRGRGMLLS